MKRITLTEIKYIESEIVKILTWDNFGENKEKVLRKSMSGIYEVIINTGGEIEDIIQTEDVSLAIQEYNKI